jgi:N4-gp56 family major capsid protein
VAGNTFIVPSVIAARALATLYNTIVLAQLVSRDYDADFNGKQGDTVTIRKPATFTTELFNRASGITMQDIVETSIPLKLDKLRNVSFLVTDEQMLLSINDLGRQALDPAAEAIAQDVDRDLATQLISAAVGAGGGGTTTMVSIANDAFRGARTKLSRNNAPPLERYAVLSPEAIAVALADPLLIQAQQAGSTDALREANIGRILGLNTYETQTLGFGAGTPGQADGLAFHTAAVILATRPLQAPRGVATEQVAVRDYKSLSLRVVYDYNHKYKQDEVSIDMLYGMASARPGLSVQLSFGQGS